MFLLGIRRVVLLIIMFIGMVFGVRLLGQQQHPFLGITLLADDGVTSTTIITDVLTHATYRQTTTVERRYSIVSQPLDGKTYVYVDDNQADEERLLAVFDAPIGSMRLTRFYTIEQPLFAVVRPPDGRGDDLAIYQLDVTTSDAKYIGTYTYDQTVGAIFPYSEDYLIIYGNMTFFIVNLETGESFSDQSTVGVRGFYPDANAIVYGQSIVIGDGDGRYTQFYHLDLNTMTSEPIMASIAGLRFADVMPSSADNVYALLVDENDQLWLYNLSTGDFTALPDSLRSVGRVYPWSGDGQYMMVRQQSEEADTYLSYHIETGALNPIFTRSQADYGSRLYRRVPQMVWSPDWHHLLVYEASESTNRHYQIYDTQTGDMLIDQAMQIPDTMDSTYMYWHQQ